VRERDEYLYGAAGISKPTRPRSARPLSARS